MKSISKRELSSLLRNVEGWRDDLLCILDIESYEFPRSLTFESDGETIRATYGDRILKMRVKPLSGSPDFPLHRWFEADGKLAFGQMEYWSADDSGLTKHRYVDQLPTTAAYQVRWPAGV